VHLCRQLVQQELRQGHGFIQGLLELLRAVCGYESIRILTFGQEDKTQLAALANLGQRYLEGAPRRVAAGTIPVETEQDLIRQTEQAIQVLDGGRRAERRSREIDPVSRKPHDIHVTFHNYQPGNIPQSLACLVESVEFTALVEQHR